MSSEEHCKIMSRPSMLIVATTSLVVLLGLVSFSSALPFMDVRRHCSADPSMSRAFDCSMNCTQLRDNDQHVCSFNLTEACKSERCLNANATFPMKTMSVVNSLPPKISRTAMFTFLDFNHYTYQACLVPKTWKNLDFPFVRPDYCGPCTWALNDKRTIKISCMGLERYATNQNFGALALAIDCQVSPDKLYPTSIEVHYLPKAESRNLSQVTYEVATGWRQPRFKLRFHYLPVEDVLNFLDNQNILP